MLLLGIVSVTLTVILVLIAVVISLVGKNEVEQDTSNGTSRFGGGKRDPWQNFGLVYNTPNLVRAVVGWDEHEGDIIDIIANVDGKKYDGEKDELVDLPPGETKYDGENTFEKFARDYLSRRIYGLPFIRKIRPVEVDRVVQKPSAPGVKRTLGEELEASTEIRYGIYGVFPRQTNLSDLDAGDKTRFSVNTTATIYLVKPRLAFSVYKDNFLQMIDKQIRAFMKSKAVSGDYDAFLKSQKEFKENDLAPLNALLITIGFGCSLLTSTDPELHPDIQTSMEAETKAKQKAKAAREEAAGERDSQVIRAEGERKAKIIEAEGTKRSTILKAEGDAEAIEKIAKAKRARVAELFAEFKGKAFSDSDALRMATDLVSAEFNAEAVANHQGALVMGQGSPVQMSVSTSRERIIEPAGEKK